MTASRTPPPAAPPLPFARGGPGAFVGKIERAKDTSGTLERIWGYLRRQWPALALASLLVLGSTATGLIGPYLLGQAIDRFILRHDLAGLARLLALMLVVYAVGALLTYGQSYVMAGAAQRTVRDLRDDLFGKLQTLPLRTFDRRSHGDLMSRLTNDVENVNLVLSDSLTQLVAGVLTMIGVVVTMVALNPMLTIVSIATISVLSLTLNRWVAPRTRESFRQQQSALGALNGLIEETVSGQRVVKAYNREPVVLTEFDRANQELRQAATRAQIFAGFIGPLMNVVNNLGLAVVAGVGGWLALNNLASVGTIASFITYTRLFGQPLSNIANLYNTIQAAIAGAERVFEILDEESEVDPPEPRPLAAVRGDVVFDRVNFSYEPSVPVLQDVSLHASPGQTIALVGPTGAGKTTIVNLLTHFYEIDRGSVLLDGRDTREIQRSDLRRQLGIVLQDTYLFSGTVVDNIRYGRLDATDAEVIAAARLANADQFIHRLPHGYYTALSERGSNLSQGQRQLLAIARVILADPKILILDEATSSIDTRTEKHIQEAMLRLMAGRTSFVIAHRLSTIRNADQILVVDRGEIVERGTHDDLLARRGFYQRLYASQFRATTAAGLAASDERMDSILPS
jgi:ATP-binding cassette subfamily B protein